MAVKVKVRCSGRMHTIVFADNGQLCLCDHRTAASRDAARAMATLGQEKDIRCLNILDEWRTIRPYTERGDSGILPPNLARIHDVLRSDKQAQRYLRKLAKQRGTPFLFAESETMPDSKTINIEPTEKGSHPIPETGYRCLAFAVNRVADELIKRGHSVHKVINCTKQSSYWNSVDCKIDKIDGKDTSVGNRYYSWNLSIDDYRHMPTYSVTKEIYPSIMADLCEMMLIRDKIDKNNVAFDTKYGARLRSKMCERIRRSYKDIYADSSYNKYRITNQVLVGDAVGAGMLASALQTVINQLRNTGHVIT